MLDNITAITTTLYLGGVEAALDTSKLKEEGITHILTLDDRALCSESTDGFVYKHVQCLDLHTYDLLSHFGDCIDFIKAGCGDGGVLVHCFAGLSRSATIVIAYLMHVNQESLTDAYEFVKQKRAIIRPNEGFMEQLFLFQTMGCRLDKQSACYRSYRLSQLAARIQAGVCVENMFEEVMSTPSTGDSVFKCKKCRTKLFYDVSLLKHKIGQGEIAFDWRGKVSTNQTAGEDKEFCEKSLFIEPIQWMGSCFQSMEGKLSCPNCPAKIGSFIWYGERCPCGTWVGPAFHIQRSKVDESRLRPSENQPVPTARVMSESFPMMTDPGPSADGVTVDDASL